MPESRSTLLKASYQWEHHVPPTQIVPNNKMGRKKINDYGDDGEFKSIKFQITFDGTATPLLRLKRKAIERSISLEFIVTLSFSSHEENRGAIGKIK
ncbi:hypothetical protein TNIN_307901 [Trichonephila inaurata madagascariensis]|uniref:Uncharacterized protein n=1 Tax=Trichonephila inaurata madagascariensis TaxID=2747483 RepID=A0A8X6XQ44_9ARAC|nr:hypothetical protein TNIN_307901 [Trichonephila inaurata madagascariensis]